MNNALPNTPLQPIYCTPSPSSPIQLFVGQLSVTQGRYTCTGAGHVCVHWGVHGPRVTFDIPALMPAWGLHPEVCELTIPLVEGAVAAFLTNVNSSGGPQGCSLGVSGIPNQQILTGDEQPVTQMLFHVVNFWSFLNPRPDQPRSDYAVDRVVFEGGGWRITLQGVENVRELDAQVRRDSTFAITHVGKAERVDGAAFSRADATELMCALYSFLSFARGMWSPSILWVGQNASGEDLWQTWAVSRASAGRNILSWFPEMEPNCLAGIFPGFMRLWQAPDTREILEVAIHWYVEANLGAGATEGAIILAQAGLERLAYYILVHYRQVLQEANFQPGGGWNAAARLRRLFVEFSLPTAVGTARYRIVTLPVLATQTPAWADAPDGLVRLRNCLVHPDQHNFQRLQNFPHAARREALTLCLWYYEMVLLKWFGYTGPYTNRQTVEFSGQTEPMP